MIEDEEPKRMKWLAFILIMLVGISISVFTWNFLDRGTISFYGDAPFKIIDYDEIEYECTSSPCELKMRTGQQSLRFVKEDFDDLYGNIQLGIFDKVDFQIDFQIIAEVTESENMPISINKEYKLILDEKNNKQKLVDTDDNYERAIVYLNKVIDNPIVISTYDYVFIVEDKGVDSDYYLINILAKEREGIENGDLINLTEGKLSLDGNYLVYRKNTSENLWILDIENNQAQELTINTSIDHVEWDYLNRLIFVTNQSYSMNSSGEHQGDIMFFSNELDNGYVFASYILEENSYNRIIDFDSTDSLPTEFIITSNGKTIYFTSESENFKIILDKV